jgi:phosphonate transport system substrate-binding protein
MNSEQGDNLSPRTPIALWSPRLFQNFRKRTTGNIRPATMVFLRSIILGSLMAFVACACGSGASAEDAGKEFRVGLIGADPGQILQDFDPFVVYLGSRLRGSGIRDVTVIVVKDVDQMHTRVKEGKLDFILASAFPIVEMERDGLVPTVLAVQGTAREYPAVFFVRKQSSLRGLGDLRGKTVVFGTPSSTAGYAMAKAVLIMNNVAVSETTAGPAHGGAVRCEFAGEAINQAFRVIRDRADAGVFSSSDWSELSRKERSQLRIIHRTAPVINLLGSFHPSFPPALREVVENTLVDMSGNGKGRIALARALHMTKFERLTEEDGYSLLRFKRLLFATD